MIRSQTRSEISSRLGELLSQQTDKDLSELILKAESDFGGLTDTEKIRFQAHALSMLRYFENVHYQYRNGMYDAEEYLAQQQAWRRFMSNTPYLRVWSSWNATTQLLGNYGEFVGAIAVVATLFYPALQVPHSREATETNTRSIEESRRLAMSQTYQARASTSFSEARLTVDLKTL